MILTQRRVRPHRAAQVGEGLLIGGVGGQGGWGRWAPQLRHVLKPSSYLNEK